MQQSDRDAIRHDARQALVECLGVGGGDRVTIVHDADREWEAVAVAAAARELGASPALFDYDHEIRRLLVDPPVFAGAPPLPLKQAMLSSDAVVIATHVEWPIHLFYAVYEATAGAQRNGARVAFLEQPLGTWDVTLAEMEEISDRVWQASRLLDGKRELHVTSPGGTDIRVRLAGRRPLHNTPVVRAGETLTFIPYYGELALAPLESAGDGRVVFDGSLLGTGVGPHEESAPEKLRRTRKGVRRDALEQPVVLDVEAGRCVRVSGGPEAAVIEQLFATIPGADRIGEVAFGTSERSQPLTAARLGTAHFAFGDNLMYGGANACAMHQNGVVLDASIQIVDCGSWILREGRWSLPAA